MEVSVRRLTMVLLVLLLGGCGATTPTGQADPPPPAGADELVFQLVQLPGLMGPGAELRLPRMTLYGDGTLILAEDNQPTQRRLTTAGVRKVVLAATDAGLTSQIDYGTPRVADGGLSVFTVVTNTRHTTKVIEPSILEPQHAARVRLHEFLTNLDDLDAWLGKNIVPEAQPYTSAQTAVYSFPQDADSPEQPWPLGDLATAGEPFGTGRCQIISGTGLTNVQDTLWRSGNQLYRVTLRPLLRHEHSCRDLG
jgi:hypothetical protein